METARCKAFLYAAETGSFSAAAEKLNYTPSGVNQLVTALENDLGFPLFVRSKKGVRLTKDGEHLLPAVRTFLQQEDRLYQLANEVRGLLTGEITIAAYTSVATHWVPPLIEAFRKDHPNIKIRLMEGVWQEVDSLLREARADIGFLSYQEQMPYDWFPLYDDPMIAVLPKDHPFAKEKAYPLSQCGGEPFIMPALGRDADAVALLEKYDLHPEIAFTTWEDRTTMTLIEHGLGMGIMNELVTLKWECDVAKLPLDPPEYITLGAAVPDLEQASPAVRCFLDYAVRMLSRPDKEPVR